MSNGGGAQILADSRAHTLTSKPCHRCTLEAALGRGKFPSPPPPGRCGYYVASQQLCPLAAMSGSVGSHAIRVGQWWAPMAWATSPVTKPDTSSVRDGDLRQISRAFRGEKLLLAPAGELGETSCLHGQR